VYREGDDLFIHELLYNRGLTNSDIATRLKEFGITRAWEIVADSAEPKSIEEIYRLGLQYQARIQGTRFGQAGD
jgi:Phage terminase large subunit